MAILHTDNALGNEKKKKKKKFKKMGMWGQDNSKYDVFAN